MRERPRLLVSLPRNDLTLAEAAVAAGAEGLKVHVNVHHHASGTHFGSWAEERETIERVVRLGVPVGLVPGTAESSVRREEWEEVVAAGVDFVDAYLRDMPSWLPPRAETVGVMGALCADDAETGWSLGPLEGACDMLEASLVPAAEYGTPLQARDLSHYRDIVARHAPLPVLAPSQRAWRPEEVEALLETGVRGILIGAVVTGRDPQGLRAATEAFAQAVGLR
jgi:hypothetical protein